MFINFKGIIFWLHRSNYCLCYLDLVSKTLVLRMFFNDSGFVNVRVPCDLVNTPGGLETGCLHIFSGGVSF